MMLIRKDNPSHTEPWSHANEDEITAFNRNKLSVLRISNQAGAQIEVDLRRDPREYTPAQREVIHNLRNKLLYILIY